MTEVLETTLQLERAAERSTTDRVVYTVAVSTDDSRGAESRLTVDEQDAVLEALEVAEAIAPDAPRAP